LNLKKTPKEMDENKLISLMENFTGQKFQWVKTDRPDLLGKVVKCRNIEPRGNRFIVLFDDGSSIDSAQLNSSLFMIHGDMQPLSADEVASIAGPKRPVAQSVTQPTPQVTMPDSTQSTQHIQGQPAVITPTQPVVSAPVTNMFDMFNSEDSSMNIALSVKLPDKKLLKLMYQNAENKDKFLDELSDYMYRMINKQVIKDSVISIVDQSKPAKKVIKSGEITATEV
jgi:hypothetical protein